MAELFVASTGWDSRVNAPVASVHLVYDEGTLVAGQVHAVNRSDTEAASVRVEDFQLSETNKNRVRTYTIPPVTDTLVAIDPIQLVWETTPDETYLSFPRYSVGMTGPTSP